MVLFGKRQDHDVADAVALGSALESVSVRAMMLLLLLIKTLWGPLWKTERVRMLPNLRVRVRFGKRQGHDAADAVALGSALESRGS